MIAPSSAFSLPFKLPPVARLGGEKGTRAAGGLEGEREARKVLGPASMAVKVRVAMKQKSTNGEKTRSATPISAEVVEIEQQNDGLQKLLMR